MVWKQDLAKLKQQLGPDAVAPAPKPPPKAAPKAHDGPIEDEDAVFLAAMGLKPAAPAKVPRIREVEPPPSTLAEPLPPESFQEAIRDLKGLKPMSKDLPAFAGPARTPQPPPVAKEKQPTPAPALPPDQALEASPPRSAATTSEPAVSNLHGPGAPSAALVVSSREAPPLPVLPVQFHLAAGMALDVDATLDLRGHSLVDALERLKDRLGDAQLLGWRILQVTLGSDPILHEGLLALLASGEAPLVTRYAQAPVPMGGNQAWLLYLGNLPTAP